MRYFWSRVFVSYDALKYLYPVLQRHKWLFPLMQFRRWGRIVLKGRVKRSVRELQISSSISPKEAKETMKFLSEIGLSDRIG